MFQRILINYNYGEYNELQQVITAWISKMAYWGVKGGFFCDWIPYVVNIANTVIVLSSV